MRTSAFLTGKVLSFATETDTDSGDNECYRAGLFYDDKGFIVPLDEVIGMINAANQAYNALPPEYINTFNDELAEKIKLENYHLSGMAEYERKIKAKPIRNVVPGFIYIIKAGPHYKIGLSKKLDQRMKYYGTKLPFEYTEIHTFATADMYATENRLHERYKEYRTNGEWFELPEHIVDEIRQINDCQESEK